MRLGVMPGNTRAILRVRMLKINKMNRLSRIRITSKKKCSSNLKR
jgi:hypothetical protein